MHELLYRSGVTGVARFNYLAKHNLTANFFIRIFDFLLEYIDLLQYQSQSSYMLNSGCHPCQHASLMHDNNTWPGALWIFGNIITGWNKAPNFVYSFLSICKVIQRGCHHLSSPLSLLEEIMRLS